MKECPRCGKVGVSIHTCVPLIREEIIVDEWEYDKEGEDEHKIADDNQRYDEWKVENQ